MLLSIRVEDKGEFVLLRCVGKLVFEQGTKTLQAVLRAQKAKAILLDFADVSVIDAAGVGTLISFHQRAFFSDQTLVIVNPNGRVGEVLRITQADSILNVRVPAARLPASSISPVAAKSQTAAAFG
jgi:anti-anti-sigma factor